MNWAGARAEDLCASLLRAAGLRLIERSWHDALELRREPDKPHDPSAVSIAWRGKLRYVPRRENAALAWGLDRGEPLRARISRLAPHPNPARRVEFEVYFE